MSAGRAFNGIKKLVTSDTALVTSWICFTVLIEFPVGGCTTCSGGAFCFRGVQTAKGVHLMKTYYSNHIKI